jgi:hypothetical protein
MSVPYLDTDMSLEAVANHLVYSSARLKHDPNARDLVPPMAALIERCTKLRVDQWATSVAETEAQAGVDAADDEVDTTVADLELVLYTELRDRSHPTYRRYFVEAPSRVIAMGLESELNRVRPWIAYLAAEPNPALQAFADRVRTAVADGDAALDARRQAAHARANLRAIDIQRFFDDVNGARRSLYAQLTQRAVERDLDRHWPDRFFRHQSRKPSGGNSGPGAPA